MTGPSPRTRRPKNTAPDANEHGAAQLDAAKTLESPHAPDALEVSTDATDMEDEALAADVAPADMVEASDVVESAPMRAPATRPLAPLASEDWLLETGPAPLIPPQTLVASEREDLMGLAEVEDPDATTQRPVAPGPEVGSRPRWNTLASAVNPTGARQPSAADSGPSASPLAAADEPDEPDEAVEDETPTRPTPAAIPALPVTPTPPEPIFEIADELDEWSIADQPTVHLTPQMLPALAEQARLARQEATQNQPRERQRPSFLDTGEQQPWPPRVSSANAEPGQAGAQTTPAPRPRGAAGAQPTPANIAPTAAPRQPTPPSRDALRDRPATPVGPVDPHRFPSTTPGAARLASPTGRPMPSTPPEGVSKAEMSNPRMRRFQELRRQRVAHEHGEQDPDDAQPFGQAIRQWWSDLRPGLASGLAYQHEARASGTHPIPAYEPAPPVSRLGDAFGRLARTARELTERAQSAATPRIKQLHDQVEHAAQGIVDRFEGNPARQQAPFLGPGRIAVFFRQGVTVGQAQRLMMSSAARPMRLIPRKHGFLARVRPGTEATTCDMLRRHPYVRDVAYLEYDEYGQPIDEE